MMTKGDALTRADVLTDAGMSAYIVTKRYGFEPPNIEFGRLASRFYGKEEKEVREKLGGIRFTADRIHQKVQEQAELTQQLQDSVQAYLREFNADGRYHLVLNEAVLMNKVAGYDITENVIKALNARYKK